MRKPVHVIAACIAMIGIDAVTGVHPAFAALKGEALNKWCSGLMNSCLRHCKTSACTNQCGISFTDCMHSGGIFMDPQRAANPGKPPRRHPRPPKLHIKPHHRPVDAGGMRVPSAGLKQMGSGHSSGTILRLHNHHFGGKR
jgi:hypothetical protein